MKSKVLIAQENQAVKTMGAAPNPLDLDRPGYRLESIDISEDLGPGRKCPFLFGPAPGIIIQICHED
jgi:hypothetical protein